VVATVLVLVGERRAEGVVLAVAGGEVPLGLVLFGLVLLGVALFHRHALLVAASGAGAITLYTLLFCPGFVGAGGPAHPGLLGHLVHEGEHTLLNLGGLLVGFALLAKAFEESGVPEHLPRLLPRGPFGSAFALLAVVWVLSAFLDNIAAAMIGGVIARSAFQGRVTIAFLAAMVASSNAGGAWSVLGDTTTTMMWIDGVGMLQVAPAIIAAVAALLVLGPLGAIGQNRVQPLVVPSGAHRPRVDGVRLFIVGLVLAGAISTNVLLDKPFVGVWAALLLGGFLRRPAWGEVPAAAKGAAFLLSLVWCASLMPVKALPAADWTTSLGLGFVSSVFDNIPLTKLALDQGGYDWDLLAFAVGFGGSMIWFGSSAGVAISKDYPEARDALRWLREGWFVLLAYLVGFFVHLALLGWDPPPPHRTPPSTSPPTAAPAGP
jgi:Na+/H+ antiporter NhaD/arsenite permease-like protein